MVILQFFGRYNFDLATVKRSCVHFMAPEGQIIPFRIYNSYYRPGAKRQAFRRWRVGEKGYAEIVRRVADGDRPPDRDA